VGLAQSSTIQAPGFVTIDAMAEIIEGPWAYKLNLVNLTNKHYADLLYRGHYVPGRPRTLQLSASYNF
jgi:catecholate siderophore receptor